MKDSEVIITKIYWERVQIYIEGYVKNIELQASNFLIQNLTETISLKPNEIRINGMNFICRINTVNIYKGNYLPQDRYLLVVQNEYKIIAKLSPDFLSINNYSLNEEERMAYDLLEKRNERLNYLLSKYSMVFRNGGNSKRYVYTVELNIPEDINEFVINVIFKRPKNDIGFLASKVEKIKQKYNRLSLYTRTAIFRMLFYTSKSFYANKKNQVLFTSDSRGELSGNLDFVYKEMKRQGITDQMKVSFIFKKHVSERRNIFDKIRFPILLGKAKYIFLDDYHPMLINLKFRRSQEIIQVWHAVGAFKTVGYSRIGKKGGHFFHNKNHRYYTKTFVASEQDIPIYAEAFGIQEKCIIPSGVPRTDVFFDKEYQKKIRENVFTAYPKIKGKNVILFAPTFRGNGHRTAFYPFFKIDIAKLADYAKRHNTIILIKMHPLVRNKFRIPKEYKEQFLDVYDYREVNNLLFITDLLVSDYSSIVYEFALLKKPMLFYAYDLDDYISSRDFYVDYNSFVPGKIVNDFDELLLALEKKDFESYKIEPFLNKHFKYLDGKATERLIENIFNHNEID